MKVYEVSEYDWVMATNPEEARRCASMRMGADDCLYDVAEIDPLSPEKMQRFTYHDGDGERTFQAELERRLSLGIVEAEFFASSEW